MDIKQLLTVGNSNTPSSSQLWFHIANAVILGIYLFIGIKLGLLLTATGTPSPQLFDSLVWYTAIVSGIITSNKFANILINLKYSKDRKDADTAGTP